MGPSSTEYYVQTTITNTQEYPAQLTSCHSHGEETYVPLRHCRLPLTILVTACPTTAKLPSSQLQMSNPARLTLNKNTAISTQASSPYPLRPPET